MLYNESSGADGTAWRCYAVLVFPLTDVSGNTAGYLYIRRPQNESGCNGRWGRIEATSIDDSTSQAHGSDRRKAGDGAYLESVEASWHHRGRHHGSVSGKQH